jgi:hypothetical protein
MDFRARLLIREDGTWTASVEQNHAVYGAMRMIDGVLRWGHGGRWYGRVLLVEHGGREYLRIVGDDGTVWSEFERVRSPQLDMLL